MVIFDSVIFMHLPKAGGTAVTAALSKKQQPRFWLRGHPTLDQVPDRLAKGNTSGYGDGKKLIFTVVRHPLEWRKSWFTHMMNNRRKLYPYHLDMYLAYRDGVRTWESCLAWCLANSDMLCRNIFPQYYSGERHKAHMIVTHDDLQQGLQDVFDRLKWGQAPQVPHKNKGTYKHDLSAPKELVARYLEAEAPLLTQFEWD